VRKRWAVAALIAAGMGILLVARARVPASSAPPAHAERALLVAPSASAQPPKPPPAAALVSPKGRRVALDTPLFARFDVHIDKTSVELALEPSAEGRLEWLSASELRFVPAGWRAGREYRVRLTGRALGGTPLEPSEWRFRTRVPAPESIVPGEGKPIVLTFDDGPHKQRQADRLLDVLRDHGARAVFFPTGRWAKTRPDWVARAVREGHRVCNHTLSHKNLTEPWMTESEIRREIAGGAGDGTCRWFRPPLLGTDARVERIAKELGSELYLWDVDSRDWEDAPAEDVENLVLANARPNAVVLLHIHAEGTHKALPSILTRLEAAGYELTHEGTKPPASRGLVTTPNTRGGSPRRAAPP
jgi:peptidoglycan/xylan/chitin deacetylase (PgdA/CDA1 family)